MPAVAWIALGTAIVSVIFNVYNLFKANQDRKWTRSEGSRKHNEELRGHLLEFLETLRDELNGAAEDLSTGRQLADQVPAVVTNAGDQFKRFDERVLNAVERAMLRSLSASVSLVEAHWSGMIGARQIQSSMTTLIEMAEVAKLASESGPSQMAHDRIDEIQRAEHLKRSDMRDVVKEVVQTLSEYIGSLNRAAAGAKIPEGSIGLLET
ncbi:hypothetical protein [Nocardia wallacei]|uniref:hypothetical protein n=1 Tax=Nocardia wallacei TaxID=480035 RepID=UPI002453F524|nr:hypothetical protein [Nocardia wallacei]